MTQWVTRKIVSDLMLPSMFLLSDRQHIECMTECRRFTANECSCDSPVMLEMIADPIFSVYRKWLWWNRVCNLKKKTTSQFVSRNVDSDIVQSAEERRHWEKQIQQLILNTTSVWHNAAYPHTMVHIIYYELRPHKLAALPVRFTKRIMLVRGHVTYKM